MSLNLKRKNQQQIICVSPKCASPIEIEFVITHDRLNAVNVIIMENWTELARVILFADNGIYKSVFYIDKIETAIKINSVSNGEISISVDAPKYVTIDRKETYKKRIERIKSPFICD